MALQDKILSLETILNPIKLSGLISEFKEHIRTDIGILDTGDMINLLKSISKESPETYVVSTDNLLYQKIENNIYELLTKSGNYDEIKLLFKSTLEDAQ